MILRSPSPVSTLFVHRSLELRWPALIKEFQQLSLNLQKKPWLSYSAVRRESRFPFRLHGATLDTAFIVLGHCQRGKARAG